MILNAAAIIIGYLFGSIPSAYIAGRLARGVDIREVGGGNVGALNTIREIGLLPGAAVLVADIGKGGAAVLTARWLDLPLAWIFGAGFAAVVGHNWPLFLGFKGGKGAATTIGVLLALTPAEAALSLAVMLVIIILTSNIRLAIVVGLTLLPLFIWQSGSPGIFIAYSTALFLFLSLRSLPSIRQALVNPLERRNLIFDREHHFWQIRKH